jgi:ATP-binding cassette subfamily B (MDR/TAP) protein 1
VTTFGFHILFGAVGDNLVYKLRTKAFKKLIKLRVGYYDKPENNPGAISAKLAQDAYLIHNMTTGSLSVVILNLSTIAAGLTLAFYYNWRLSLIVLGLSPLLTLAGSINMKRMKNYAQQTDEAYKQAGTQISDTVCNIRTVKSFGNNAGLIRAYNKKLEVPYQVALKKALTSGFFQGLGQGMVLGVYGLVFFLAAVLKVKVYDSSPADIFISIFAIVFAAVGLGNNTQMMPDMAKAKNAGANIFEILE